MSGWLLAAAALGGEPTLEERLLGPPSAEAAPAPPPADAGLPLWPLGVAVAGAALALWARRRATGAAGRGSDLRVVSTVAVGKDNALAVVEVLDADGTWRRLLVGAGQGAPQLLTELGDREPGPRRAAHGRALVDEVLGARTTGPSVRVTA